MLVVLVAYVFFIVYPFPVEPLLTAVPVNVLVTVPDGLYECECGGKFTSASDIFPSVPPSSFASFVVPLNTFPSP